MLSSARRSTSATTSTAMTDSYPPFRLDSGSTEPPAAPATDAATPEPVPTT
jgi:hypothetical protein